MPARNHSSILTAKPAFDILRARQHIEGGLGH